MKKIISIFLIFICCLALCACGQSNAGAVPEANGMTSTLPDEKLKDSSEENNDDLYTMALSYVDKPVDELIAAIGEPESREYSPSCLGDGEDGNLQYNGFFVYTYKEGDVETVKEVSK